MTDAFLDTGRTGFGFTGIAEPGPREAVPADAARFLLAGGLASLVNWLARFPLSLVLPFDLAVGTAYVVGMALGFWLYRAWVFPGSALPLSTQLGRFIAVNALGLAVVLIGARLLVEAIDASGFAPVGVVEAAAHGAAIMLGAAVNFLGHRALTFARRRAA